MKVNNLKSKIKKRIYEKILKDFLKIKLRYMLYPKKMAPFVFDYDEEINTALEELKEIDKNRYNEFLNEICSYFVLLDKRKLDLIRYDEDYEVVYVLSYHPFE